MKRTGIPIKGVKLKDGKIIAGQRRMSVSERIRERKRPKTKVRKVMA